MHARNAVLYCILYETDGSSVDSSRVIQELHSLVSDDLRMNPVGILFKDKANTGDICFVGSTGVDFDGTDIVANVSEAAEIFGFTFHLEDDDEDATALAARIMAMVAKGQLACGFLVHDEWYEFDPDSDIPFDTDSTGNARCCYAFPFPIRFQDGAFTLPPDDDGDDEDEDAEDSQSDDSAVDPALSDEDYC